MLRATIDSGDAVATYVRVSTAKQDESRQNEDIQDFLDDHGIDSHDAYVDLARSGSDDTREDFNELVGAVAEGQYDHVVMSEISRMARRNATAADFIDGAVENETTIHLLDDMIDEIQPGDPMSQFFAKFLSLWYEEERKQTIRRIKSGLKQARREGKWVGAVPKGFQRNDDGYLELDMQEYLALVGAMERLDAGEKVTHVAEDTGFNRVTLTNIFENDEKRKRYLNAEPDDERIANALSEL